MQEHEVLAAIFFIAVSLALMGLFSFLERRFKKRNTRTAPLRILVALFPHYFAGSINPKDSINLFTSAGSGTSAGNMDMTAKQ